MLESELSENVHGPDKQDSTSAQISSFSQNTSFWSSKMVRVSTDT